MVLMFITFFVVLLSGSPVLYSFAFASIVYGIQNPDIISSFPALLYSSLDSFPLLAIPFFIYAGNIMSHGGISEKLITFATALMGKVKGYLGAITVIAGTFFSAISGSGIATVGAIGTTMIPAMVKNGYPKGYSTVLTASASFLGVIIPPSIPMVLYGYMANASILDLFIGGVTPGVILILLFLIINYFYASQFQKDKNISFETEQTKETSLEINQNQNRMLSIFKTGRSAFFALMMPFIIIGGIYTGIFTATEAAVVSVIYAILIGFLIYKQLTIKVFYKLTIDTVYTTSFLMITLVFATIFSRILTLEKVPEKLANLMINVFPSEWAIILIIILFLLIVGMLMDTITAVIIATPILVPIANSIGMDLVHFGVTMVLVLAIGQITPPMAINLFLAGKISGASFKEQLKYLFPFIVGSIIIAILISFVPKIVLFLPQIM